MTESLPEVGIDMLMPSRCVLFLMATAGYVLLLPDLSKISGCNITLLRLKPFITNVNRKSRGLTAKTHHFLYYYLHQDLTSIYLRTYRRTLLSEYRILPNYRLQDVFGRDA